MLLAVTALMYSCEPKVVSIDLDGKIRAYVSALPDTTSIFKITLLDSLFVDWDHLTIINPYTPADSIRNLRYVNLRANKGSIIDNTYQEGVCQLILSIGEKVVSVDVVKRDVIDFAMLKVAGRVNGIEILKRDQVRELMYTRNLVTMGRFVPELK